MQTITSQPVLLSACGPADWTWQAAAGCCRSMVRGLATSITLLVLSGFAGSAWADQSSITEADGQSCMGDDKSRKETKNVALQDAKRLAMEYAGSYLESESIVENFELKSDLVKAFRKAEVKVIDILEETWADGGCYTIRIKAEVIPNNEVMQTVNTTQMMADPRAPLNVKLWTSKDAYSAGENVRIYLQGNKPFYARLIYVDADSNNIQLLPNQHRSDNYFAGATIFEVPGNQDKFLMTVGAPFGAEKLVLYASTSPLGQITATPAGADVFVVAEAPQEISRRTRGISITKAGAGGSNGQSAGKPKSGGVAEFAESEVAISTSASE
jgi:hypothetical protein